jgi:DNA-binding CsgD family transcriptional regulator
MMTNPNDEPNRDRQLLVVLQRLLTLEPGDLSAAMTTVAQQVAEVLGADKVDIFFYVPAEQALVAEGTSDTPMGQREHELGLDRLPLAGGGRTIEVFRTGHSHRADHVDQDADEVRGLVEDLGVRASIAVALDIAGTRRGVLLASSATPAAFTQADLHFLEAIAHWIGLTAARLAQAEVLAARAAEQALQQAAEQLQVELTPRQREVAGLVSGGMSNQEIARQLVLEPGTVANHVAAILGRLGFRSRTQIAVWAAERGVGRQTPPSSPP